MEMWICEYVKSTLGRGFRRVSSWHWARLPELGEYIATQAGALEVREIICENEYGPQHPTYIVGVIRR